MKNRNKAILFVGVIALAYFILSSRKKVSKPVTQTNNDSSDGLVSNYNIVPLPDIKNYKFTSVNPLKVIGQTGNSPIMIATAR